MIHGLIPPVTQTPASVHADLPVSSKSERTSVMLPPITVGFIVTM
jgi:hypothetical protein